VIKKLLSLDRRLLGYKVFYLIYIGLKVFYLIFRL